MADILTFKIEFNEEEKQKIVKECIEYINDRLIEELKKIKEELKEESDFTGAGHLVVEWETIEKVIDNRISELKGEQE